jgi:hypothetical protein
MATKYLSFEEHYKIARELEKHHALFERVWSTGTIRFTKQVPTASVLFNKKGDCIDFLINPTYWEELSFTKKCFVISHECFHIALNHGKRSLNLKRKFIKMANIAQDISINHALVTLYGYDRAEVDPENGYCWADKIPLENGETSIPENKNYEYYYNRLMKLAEEAMKELGETVDEHGMGGSGGDFELDPDDFEYIDFDDYTDNFDKAIDKLNEELTDDEKENIEGFIKKNENKDQSKEEEKENPDYGPTGISSGAPQKGQNGGQQAGTTAGTGWTFAKKIKVIKKHKWEHIITSWAKKRMKWEYKEVDQWTVRNRRFSMVDTGLILPTEYETLENVPYKDKINVWFYQDTSGSCGGYVDRFFSIAEAMPLDRFNMRMFCFDTKTYETSLESRKLSGFGGTYFHILENRIQDEMRNDRKFKYPDAIFVVTDGYGSEVIPSNPERWHWILTPDGSKSCIPDTCNFYNLKDYE